MATLTTPRVPSQPGQVVPVQPDIAPGHDLSRRSADVASRPMPPHRFVGRAGVRSPRRPAVCAAASPGTLRGARLTRRGRVVVALVWVLFAAIAAVLIARPSNADTGMPTSTVRVAPGDTLWKLAADVSPAGDTREAVDTIVELNDLASPGDIQPGDTLRMPADG